MRNDEYHISEIAPLLSKITSSMWLTNNRLKYLNIHTDTRRGMICWMSDRNGSRVTKEQLEEAIENTKWEGEELVYPYNMNENELEEYTSNNKQ